MATYYVDSTEGSDDNSGLSPQTPWRSLERASEPVFTRGDELLLKRGARWEGMLRIRGRGTTEKPVVVRPYGQGDAPIVNGAGASAAVLLAGISHCRVEGLVVENRVGDPDDRQPRQGICVMGAAEGITEDVTVRECTVRHVDGENRRARNAYESMYWNGGIYVSFPGRTSKDSHLHRIVIEDNHVHDVRTSGIRVNQSEDFVNTDIFHTNVVVRGNCVERTGSDGIIVANCVSPIIDSNDVFDAGALGTLEDTQLIAGLWVCATSNAVVQRNVVCRTRLFENDGTAFDTDWGTAGDTVFQYNLSYANEGGFWLNCTDLNVRPDMGVTRLLYNVSIADQRGLCLYDTGVPIEVRGSLFLLAPGAEACVQGSGLHTFFSDCVFVSDSGLEEGFWKDAGFAHCEVRSSRSQHLGADGVSKCVEMIERARSLLDRGEPPRRVYNLMEKQGVFRSLAMLAALHRV